MEKYRAFCSICIVSLGFRAWGLFVYNFRVAERDGPAFRPRSDGPPGPCLWFRVSGLGLSVELKMFYADCT